MRVPGITFRRATAADDGAVRALLAAAGLPADDVAIGGGQEYLLAEEGGTLVGSVGLEAMGDLALLRSFAVAPALRGRGLGGELYRRVLEAAALRGVRTAYVLTTTMERFCLAHGFERVERSAIPAAIAASAQFRSLCPSTAACLRRPLSAG